MQPFFWLFYTVPTSHVCNNGLACVAVLHYYVTDVIFVKEEKATDEQIARAAKYGLPPSFYMNENKKSECKGCPGCDNEPNHHHSSEGKYDPFCKPF